MRLVGDGEGWREMEMEMEEAYDHLPSSGLNSAAGECIGNLYLY